MTIATLQLLTGKSITCARMLADVDEDKKVTHEEVVNTLQKIYATSVNGYR